MVAAFKQNELFRGLQNDLSRLNACVGNNGGPYDLYDYSWGYFEGTRLLLTDAKVPGATVDVLVYPICFNFRHAVELYIKYVIADLGRVKGTGQQYQAGHTLLRNWKKAKKLLSAIDHTAADAALFEEVVKHIEEVDPTGQTFRYPRVDQVRSASERLAQHQPRRARVPLHSFVRRRERLAISHRPRGRPCRARRNVGAAISAATRQERARRTLALLDLQSQERRSKGPKPLQTIEGALAFHFPNSRKTRGFPR